MALKSTSGLSVLSCTFCFAVSRLFGPVNLSFFIQPYKFISFLKFKRNSETEQGVTQAIIKSTVNVKRDLCPLVSDNAKDLVKKMLNPDPTLRLSSQEVLDHPWMQNAKKAPNVSLGETVKARLKQFWFMNKLNKRALRVIAESLSAEEVAGIKQGFDLMDTNKQGKITMVELKAGLQKLGHEMPDTDVQMLMEAGDVDSDDYLNYGEFVAISVHLRKMGNDDDLKEAFEFFDKIKNGYIEVEELTEALADEIETDNEEVISAIIQDVPQTCGCIVLWAFKILCQRFSE